MLYCEFVFAICDSSLITVGSGFPASLQAFGLLDEAQGAVCCVHNLRFLPSPTL